MSLQGRTMYSVPLPLEPHVWGRLTIPVPLTEQEWTRLIELLTAMKVGLVPPLLDEAAP